MPINQTGTHMDTAAHEYRDEWQEVPLASVADIRFSSVNKVSQPGEQPVRLCNYTDVYKNDYITADMDFMRATATRSEIERFVLQVGDVIITKDSETPDDIGIPSVVDTTAPDVVCGYHLALLRPNQAEVDPTFLAKQLAHHRIARYFGQQANGSTRYSLSTAAIANAPLHLPRPENQRSASILMRLVDTHITQTEAVTAKLKQVRAGMLHDLLSYGLDENGQLRDPIAHPEQFKDSPLGRIPRAWNICTLTDLGIGKLVNGVFKEPKRVGNGVPLVNVADLYRGESIELDGCERFSATPAEIARYRVLQGDIFFTRSSLKLEGIAQTSFMASDPGDAVFECHVMRLMPNPEKIVPRFLKEWCVGHYARRHFMANAKQVTMTTISQEGIQRLNCPQPPLAEQIEAVCKIETMDGLLAVELDLAQKLKYEKQALQDDLLTGRVPVPKTIVEGAAAA
ncbi:MAG: restriction endonuclease subunit S [Deltaproteobacteria bacterium]|nr:restriction endonuclease subunit S [Deltaproteobacteria bacterium]